MSQSFGSRAESSGAGAPWHKEIGNLREELRAVAQRLQVIESQGAERQQTLERQESLLRELLWGQVFHDSIADCRWLSSKAFSPGRWAAGYPLLYVLYRVLADAAPRRILELGLGQTTRMIAQYAANDPDRTHLVVEHDEEWIGFFSRNLPISEQTSLLRMNLAHNTGDGAQGGHAVASYEDFTRRLRGHIFDLILIDGPYGGRHSGESVLPTRTDVIGLLPGCLAASFVILLDDAQRMGELKTADLMRGLLTASGIKHVSAYYRGEKTCLLIASEDNKFLCSL